MPLPFIKWGHKWVCAPPFLDRAIAKCVLIHYFAYSLWLKTQLHGEEHVKKVFSTAVIANEDTHSNLVRGHCFTGEDTNIFHPW